MFPVVVITAYLQLRQPGREPNPGACKCLAQCFRCATQPGTWAPCRTGEGKSHTGRGVCCHRTTETNISPFLRHPAAGRYPRSAAGEIVARRHDFPLPRAHTWNNIFVDGEIIVRRHDFPLPRAHTWNNIFVDGEIIVRRHDFPLLPTLTLTPALTITICNNPTTPLPSTY